jgi:hypothetical protein
MNNDLKNAYLLELRVASTALDHERAFHHLERAHILSQRYTLPHMRVHWRMLRLGIAIGDWKEIFGQVVRIVAAALFSRIWIPAGNTGRANVSAFKPMPIPDDLRNLL